MSVRRTSLSDRHALARLFEPHRLLQEGGGDRVVARILRHLHGSPR